MRISHSFSRPFTAWATALIFRLLCLLAIGALGPGRGWQFYATDLEAYQADRDITVFHSGKSSAHLRSNAGASPSGFGLFWQKVDARKYRGQRLRLSGYLRTSGVSGWAGLWLPRAFAASNSSGLVMDFFPPFAEIRNRWIQSILNPGDFRTSEAHIFPQCNWSRRTVEVKHCLTAISYDMHIVFAPRLRYRATQV